MTGNGGCRRGAETSCGNGHEGALLPIDSLLDVLADAHRRQLLSLLRERPGGTVSVEAAGRRIAAQVRGEKDSRSDYEAVEVALYHHHLPKLADAGVVEYDVRSQAIRYRPDDRLEALHDAVREFQRE